MAHKGLGGHSGPFQVSSPTYWKIKKPADHIEHSTYTVHRVYKDFEFLLMILFFYFLGVHATDNAFCPKACATWIREMIQKCYDIGLIVKVIVMDMGGGNQAV